MGKKRKEMNKSQPHPRVYSITRTTSTIFQIGKNTKMVEKREKEKRKRKKVKKSYLEGTPNTCFSVQILTWYQLLDQDNEHFWTQGQKHLPGMREMQTAYPVLWDQVIISEIPTHKVHPCFCEQEILSRRLHRPLQNLQVLLSEGYPIPRAGSPGQKLPTCWVLTWKAAPTSALLNSEG